MTTDTKNIRENLMMDFQKLKRAYRENPAPACQERRDVLLALKKSIVENEQLIYDALNKDYGYRSEFDSLMADVLPTVSAINYAIKRLKKWMKPSKRHAGFMLSPSKVMVHYQPLGVVGVISPWNFPVNLSLSPTVQALSAGNRVMIKLSEFTPNVNRVIRKVVEPIFEYIVIVEGEADVASAFSTLPFDHLIFTGSTAVGKLVAKAAAENLTPITLELGGKSPTIIDKDINMRVAVDAVIVGKSVNSGQICVAPDYIFVPKNRQQEFINTFKKRYEEYYLSDKSNYRQTHIITDRQFERVERFLKDAEEKGANIHQVKTYTENDKRLMYPHILTEVTDDMTVMQEEIFGSILPVMPYDEIDEVISYINARSRPLALYIMSKNKRLIDKVLKMTHSGGVSINDCVMHVAADDAPFGGIGHSGMGHYHGHEGFLTFSKAKTVLESKAWIPKNRFMLKNRDLMFKLLRKFLLK